MLFTQWRTSFLKDTVIYSKMSHIESIYSEIDEEIRAFSMSALPKCPSGCGRCCEGFEPDISEPESYYLAAYIFLVKPELAPLLGTEESRSDSVKLGGCPLFDSSKDEHCPIYPARPLICRGFAFSAIGGKNGPQYRLCSWMDEREGRRMWSAKEIEKEFGVRVPILDRYGRKLNSPSSPSKQRLLGTEAHAALTKIKYYHDIFLRKDDGSDGGDLPRSA